MKPNSLNKVTPIQHSIFKLASYDSIFLWPADGRRSRSHRPGPPEKQNRLAALSAGTLHGFAGVSHFLLILPTLMLPNISESEIYLTGFAAGTILAMVIYAIILGLFSVRASDMPGDKVFKIIRIIAGIMAVFVGLYWILA